jgi:NADH dehydrogenase
VGISPNPLTAGIDCEEILYGRPVVDGFLRVKGCENVWAVGDSACILDEVTGEPFPATAQHALREAEVAAENIISSR